MARQRSPIVTRCEPWPFPPRAGERRRSLCRWVCARDPRGAEFVQRHGRQTAVLHPSTKRPGWQVSFFDELGAVSDVIRSTCNAALKDAGIIPATWRLRAAEPLAGVRRAGASRRRP